MGIKITIPNTSSDVLTFGSGNTPTAAQIAGIDSGSSNGQLALYTTASGTSTERVRVDASGNVGIGTSSPTVKLDVRGNGLKIYDSGSATANLQVRNSTTGDAAGFTLQQDGVNTLFYNNSNGASVFATNGTERMRIDSSGKLLVGLSTAGALYTTKFQLSTDSGTTKWEIGPYNTTTNFVISASATGGVYLSGVAGTSWLAASDERVKENLKPITDAVNKVASLRALTGNYINDESKTSHAFLIAQDVLKVLPEAVDTQNPDKYGLSYTEIIPLLVASIQEQQAIITSLTDRLTLLESK